LKRKKINKKLYFIEWQRICPRYCRRKEIKEEIDKFIKINLNLSCD